MQQYTGISLQQHGSLMFKAQNTANGVDAERNINVLISNMH